MYTNLSNYFSGMQIKDLIYLYSLEEKEKALESYFSELNSNYIESL